MNKLLAVIRREYLGRVRNKWFVFSTVFIPILLVAVVGLPSLLVVRQEPRDIQISVIDMTAELLPALLETDAFDGGGFDFVASPFGGSDAADREWMIERVANKELGGYLYIPPDLFSGGSIEYWGRNASNPLVTSSLRSAVTAAARRVQADRLGIDSTAVALLSQSVDIEAFRVTGDDTTREGRLTWLLAEVLGLSVYMVIILYGAMMLRASVAEKSNKMIEVILSSLRPWQLMLGKTLGVGAVGVTQVAVWVSFVVLALLFLTGAAGVEGAQLISQLPLGFDTLALFVGLFLTGFFIYAGLYAAVGAIAASEQDASQLQLPVTLIALVPAILLPSVLNDPISTSSIVLSWVPVFAPVVFIGRFVLDATASWEIVMVFGIQLVTIVLVAWIGGRIFRVGLLMTGKRPTLRELARWVRHG